MNAFEVSMIPRSPTFWLVLLFLLCEDIETNFRLSHRHHSSSRVFVFLITHVGEGTWKGGTEGKHRRGEEPQLLDWNKKRKKVGQQRRRGGRMNEDIKVNWVFSPSFPLTFLNSHNFGACPPDSLSCDPLIRPTLSPESARMRTCGIRCRPAPECAA